MNTSVDNNKKNQFYKNYYQQVIWALLASLGLLLLLEFLILYQVYHKPLPPFDAIAPNGQMMSLRSYDEPSFTSDTVLRWARRAVVSAYTFDFVNGDRQIAEARPFFTPTGWQAYQSAITPVIETVKRNQLFVYGVVSGTPVISNQNTLPGYGYTWRVQIPFLVTYESSSDKRNESYLVTMMVVKVPTNIDPSGIGIERFQM